jgi:hypothetical protein
MTRSLGFGSKASNSSRPVQTRFRCASAYRLKLARYFKSLTHNTKGTPSAAHQIASRFVDFSFEKPSNSQQRFEGRPPTVCRCPVSGTVSLPSSGCFSPFPHGTCSLSVAEEYLGLEGGPPAFRQDCTCPALLESLARALSIRGCHPLRPGFPAGSGRRMQKHWPRPRSLATTDGVSLMSFPPGTEMFQFPGFALIPL